MKFKFKLTTIETEEKIIEAETESQAWEKAHDKLVLYGINGNKNNP